MYHVSCVRYHGASVEDILEGAFLPLYRCRHAWGECVLECVCTSVCVLGCFHSDTVRIKDPNVDFIFLEFGSFFRGVS